MTVINKNIAFTCPPQLGGVEALVYVYNFSEWKQNTIAVDTGVTEEITSITNGSGIQAWSFAVPKAANIIATSPLRRVDGIDGHDHSVDIRVGTIEQVDANQISCMRFNKVVVIVQLLEGRSKVYGQNVGLRLIEYDQNDGDPGTGGTIRFLAQTDDKEPPEIDTPQLIASTFDVSTLTTPGV